MERVSGGVSRQPAGKLTAVKMLTLTLSLTLSLAGRLSKLQYKMLTLTLTLTLTLAGRLSKLQYKMLVATSTSASLLKDAPPPIGSPRSELTSLAALTPARPMTAPQGLRTA